MSNRPRLTSREKAQIVGAVVGCLFGAVGIWVVIIGLPIGIYLGITSGDWRMATAVTVLGLMLAIANKLGWTQSLND